MPFFFLLLYVLLGSEFILFQLVDEVSIFAIQYWVSNLGLYAHVVTTIYILEEIIRLDYNAAA